MKKSPSYDPDPAELEAMLAAIVASSDDAIVSKSLAGIVRTWNQAAERIFGYSADEMIGQPINIIVPADRQAEEPEILRRIRNGDRVEHFETVRRRKDGRLIDVSVTISPIRTADGTIIGASKIARDITPQKYVQRELQHAKEIAEAASRAKDDFLRILSHELRTPLTPALNAVSLLEATTDHSQEERSNYLAIIRRSIETEARLVDGLLDLTRIAQGKGDLRFETIDAHASLRQVAATLKNEIELRRLKLSLRLEAEETHVWADERRLQQVFANLLSNAIKFTRPDGLITITTSNQDRRLLVEVSDDGIGISAGVLPRLFNAFELGDQAAASQFSGLGLGLSIVRALLDLHGAVVTARSEGLGKGSTFTVDLPLVRPAALPGSPEEASRMKRCRILLVEDHSDTRIVLARLLAKLGCVVASAGTVKEAMQLADGQTFDLLVSDIGLPDGSGIQIMTHMRARHGVRGIALSGFGQDEDLVRSKEAGFDRHLTKPVSFQVLKDVIEEIVA